MKTSEPIVAVRKQRSALVIDRLMAGVRCVALHTFFALPGWVGTGPRHPAGQHRAGKECCSAVRYPRVAKIMGYGKEGDLGSA